MQPINDLSARMAAFRPVLRDAMDRVLDRGWLVLGPEVAAFESAFARYTGASQCIGVANGTDALELALRAIGIGHGSRVVTVANAGGYTCTALSAIGATPVFVDIDEHTQLATYEGVEEALAAGADAVVLTHLFGRAVPATASIAALCAARGVKLLEDCAQAHGARLDGQHVGTFGDAGTFSFYPTKNLGALGDGGAVVAMSADVADRVRRLRQYGWTSKYKTDLAGGRNSRLDELQAAVLMAFLPELDAMNARRRHIATRYSKGIASPHIVTPTAEEDDNAYVAHLYVIRSERRDELRQHLHAEGILSDVHYPIPDHRQSIASADGRLPVTEALAERILTLPCYPEMDDATVDRIIDAIGRWAP